MSKVDKNLWENDPSLVPMTDKRRKQIDDMKWATLKKSNWDLKKYFANDPEGRKSYDAWLSENAEA